MGSGDHSDSNRSSSLEHGSHKETDCSSDSDRKRLEWIEPMMQEGDVAPNHKSFAQM